MKKQPTKIPTSEAALKRWIKGHGDRWLELWENGEIIVFDHKPAYSYSYIDRVLWRGRFSDFYKKRSPLKGVMRKIRKAIK